LSYKCRKSGTIFIRTIASDFSIGPERPLTVPRCVGGVDFAISGDTVLLRVDGLMGNNLVTMTSKSDDRGINIPAFSEVDLGGFVPDQHLPTTASVFQDFLR
jgi:hypothetical protein